MEPREIWAPKQRFKSLDLLLGLSDCSLQGRCLAICCSEAIAEKLKAKLDILLLRFGQLESILINDQVVYRFLSVVLDPQKDLTKIFAFAWYDFSLKSSFTCFPI